jgi:P-type Cu+ transporter
MEQARQDFGIKGMHCASCVNVIERSLRKIDGVKEATVNLANESGCIVCDEKIPEKKIQQAMKKVGYEAVFNVSDEERAEAKKKELRNLKIKVSLSAILSAIVAYGNSTIFN